MSDLLWPVLVIRVRCEGVDPSINDPLELAEYLIDPDADDPVPGIVTAEWETSHA